MIISPLPLERSSFQQKLGRKFLMAAFREASIKIVKKNKKGRGAKKKSGKPSPNKHRDRTATARGPEKSRGPGSSTKDGARRLRMKSLPIPSHLISSRLFCSLRRCGAATHPRATGAVASRSVAAAASARLLHLIPLMRKRARCQPLQIGI